MLSEQDVSIVKTFQRLWPLIASFKLGLIIAAIALILNAITDTSMITLLKPLIDHGFGQNSNQVLSYMALLILMLVLFRGITSYISTYCLAWVSGKVVMILRQRLFSHFMGIPVSYFDQQSTGTLLSRITYDSEQVAESSARSLITIVREGAYIITLFGVMISNSWQLSVILLVITPIVAAMIKSISKRFRYISKNMQNTMGHMTASAEQMLKGHKEVLIFGGQEIETERFGNISNKMRQQGMKMVTASAIAEPVIQLIASFALSFVLFASSFPEIKASLTPGAFTVVFSAMFALMKPLKLLTNVNVQFQRGMAACQTLFSILDMPLEQDNGKIELQRAKGDIEFRHVTFSYPTKKDEPVLKDISFTIPAGKTVALVGRSGSGKSTIANLVPRFYDIQSGEILLDDCNLTDYTLKSLRKQIGLVSQNVYLFNDTIANNITYASDISHSREEIIRVAKMAHVMDFVEKLDNGLDTVIGENGVLLSGGQRQRIAIARALLRNNPILILDEATSALDTESERVIQQALDTLQQNRTSLVIAHRLSTIEKADEIIVIDNGVIVERGNHNTLLALKNGSYAQLYQIQFNDN